MKKPAVATFDLDVAGIMLASKVKSDFDFVTVGRGAVRAVCATRSDWRALADKLREWPTVERRKLAKTIEWSLTKV